MLSKPNFAIEMPDEEGAFRFAERESPFRRMLAEHRHRLKVKEEKQNNRQKQRNRNDISNSRSLRVEDKFNSTCYGGCGVLFLCALGVVAVLAVVGLFLKRLFCPFDFDLHMQCRRFGNALLLSSYAIGAVVMTVKLLSLFFSLMRYRVNGVNDNKHKDRSIVL